MVWHARASASRSQKSVLVNSIGFSAAGPHAQFQFPAERPQYTACSGCVKKFTWHRSPDRATVRARNSADRLDARAVNPA